MADNPGAGRRVPLGDRVTIRYESGPQERGPDRGGGQASTTFDITADSPLARALLGKRAGDLVSLELTPGAEIAFVIVRIE